MTNSEDRFHLRSEVTTEKESCDFRSESGHSYLVDEEIEVQSNKLI